uniref:Ig-like domain-containing protein n=1 Tax=Pygocentrus nattereri TaxID=42514 RepID=A0AAR2KDP7_PYGNA
MSSEGDPGGQPSTTALSTVAVQAGDTQIVVAVLKCGEFVNLQLTEAHPDLLEIGNNQDESKKLLEEHDQLLARLKRNEGGVWALLEQADEVAEERKGEERVYEAMARSLSEAWTTLVSHLEKRRTLLLLTCQFYDHALEFAVKIDEAEELHCFVSVLLSLNRPFSFSGLLVKSMLLLNKTYELLDFLEDFRAEAALQYGGSVVGARVSRRKVEGLLELLQDRRTQVDLRMAQQIHDLELIHRICQWEQQEQEVTRWFKENANLFLENNQLGSSLSESEELLHKYKEFELKAKWGMCPIYAALCAFQAFEVLAATESSIKSLKTETLPLPELAKKHEELHRCIKDAAADPLHRGQLILQKLNSQSVQVGGVQRMLGYLRERVDGLSRQCQAYRELAGKKQQLLTSIDDLEDKVQEKNDYTSGFSVLTQPGSSLSEAQDTLNRHLELSTHMQVSPSCSKIQNHSLILILFLQVDEQVKMLLGCFKNRPDTEEENEEVGATMKEVMDARWQSFLQKFLFMQDQGNNFSNSSNMVSSTLSLNVRGAMSVVEKTIESLTKKKAELSDVWTSWQLHYSQMKSVKKQWKKFKEQLKKVVHELKSLEGVLTPTSKVDLGHDVQTVAKLQKSFNSTKPQFLQLNAEVEFLVKTSELLALKGIPMKEKNDRVSELLLVHQRVRDKIREYEAVLSMAVKFHQLHQELDTLLKAEPVKGFSDPTQARMQLSQHQDRQNHVRHLYKLAISLGADITSTVQQSQVLVFSVQDKMEHLRCGSVSWAAQASRCEESLMSNMHYCIFKEEIGELRESFKDLKKKFNNLKFNYMKKNEKMRNLKAVKNQIQQIEIYTEKLQVLKKKLQAFALKLSSNSEKHLIGSSPRELEDAVNELQRQVGDFDRTVEEYKHNLDLSMKLQQAMEEYQFWCDEASSTIVRVGKYSSQCKTKEAITTLYKQFEKFVWPTIPQQEERINQITELAVRLHGAEEGKKYMEKTVTKHTEIVDAIKELSSGLLDLEARLQTGHTPEMTGPDGTKEEPVTKKPEGKKTQLAKSQSQDLPDKPQSEEHKVLSETRSYTQEAYSKMSMTQTTTSKSTVERKEETHTSFSHTHTFSVSSSPVERDRKIYTLQQAKRPSQDTPPPQWPQCSDVQREEKQAHHDAIQVVSGPHTTPHAVQRTEGPLPAEEELFSQPLDGDFQHDHLTEESFSNDEYECTSPDDISLPPLSETPESNMVLSENDLDLDSFCVSSHSTHLNQFSQHGASSQTESYPSPTAGLAGRFRAESSAFVHSPLTVPTPTIISSTISSILKSSKPGSLTECHQTLHSVHESRTETQGCVHEPVPARNVHARASNMHAPPKPPLTSEQEPELCRPTAIREEVRRVSGARAVGNLATAHGPNFSKHLSNATVMEGSPVTLEVEVTGFPEPALTWFKNGQKVTNGERASLSHKEGKHALFIESAEERDSGQYVVSASNSAGTVSSSSVLHVKGKRCHDLDTLKLDWQTCFGTLCVLLWLLYLLVL